MPDEVDSLNDQQSGSQEPPGDPGPTPERGAAGSDVNEAGSASAHRGNAAGSTGSGETVDHGADLVLWNKLLTWFTAVLAVVALGTLAVTAFQLNAMLKQLDQMVISNDQVRRSVEQASRQAAAAEAANIISKESVNNANRSFITETIKKDGNLLAGSDFHIAVGMKAIGSTPAIEVQDRFQAMIGQTIEETDLVDSDVVSMAEVIMFPTVAHGETLTIPASQLSQETVDSINSERRHIYVHGLILYKDFSGATHFVRACQKYDPSKADFKACSRRRSNLAN